MTVLHPSPKTHAHLLARLAAGACIGLPTETVYGLAGDAENAEAVARIFATKTRPRFNPLICHVATRDMAQRYGVFDRTAVKLAEAFWPGPLTLVVPRRADCPAVPLVSAGLDTIALRQPDHAATLRLIGDFDRALAAPSANPSERLSPSCAAHVAAMLPDIEVLDGGACRVGLESTIIGCFTTPPCLMRAGGLTRAEIEARIGAKLAAAPQTASPRAPGQMPRHYAPRARLALNADPATKCDAFLGFADVMRDMPQARNLSASGDLHEAAANLFGHLHALDDALAKTDIDRPCIGIAPIPDSGLGEAINDRLRRAAS